MRKFILLLFFCGSLFSYTMSDLIKDIRLQLGDTSVNTNDYYWEDDPDLYRRIELAQTVIARKTGCLETSAFLTTTANVSTYTLADFLEVRRVEYGTTTAKEVLNYITKRKLDSIDTEWQSDSGKPLYWYKESFGAGIIGLYPKPSATYAGTNALKYYYIEKLDSFDTYVATTTLFNGKVELTPYYQLITDYVCMLCMRDLRQWDIANAYKAAFDEGLLLMIGELNSATIERTLKPVGVPIVEPTK